RKLVTSVVCLPTTASAGLLSPDSRPSQAPAQRRPVHGKHLQELAMKTCLRRALVWSLGRLLGLVAAVALAAGAAHAVAQDIVHVEEDWEMVLGSPDAATCGPQVVLTMSPLSDISDTFFTMEINHRSAPYWTPGGITI